ncbi:hypothetical protein GCM10011273_18210 [Asticcacaulis endophyticus]|uniref:Uncharacterized protein n=1 Tax=Asticcacaulis endophyticus TaxID=1395890 RepID=A0A918Q567_9CAUL|nr:hypothetical protein GCM10011273_18210 [Asticcacaulis endophyticus]
MQCALMTASNGDSAGVIVADTVRPARAADQTALSPGSGEYAVRLGTANRLLSGDHAGAKMEAIRPTPLKSVVVSSPVESDSIDSPNSTRVSS